MYRMSAAPQIHQDLSATEYMAIQKGSISVYLRATYALDPQASVSKDLMYQHYTNTQRLSGYPVCPNEEFFAELFKLHPELQPSTSDGSGSSEDAAVLKGFRFVYKRVGDRYPIRPGRKGGVNAAKH